MSRTSRISAALAALALLAVFIQPLWTIRLGAPQYPEGLGLDIWVNQIVGMRPGELQSINGLNHYIGMKKIEPDAIAELRFMPWIVSGLAAFGLLVAATGKRALLYTWVIVFAVIALAGLYDFWRWEYDYGHDLDPTAAIKVPGMSYQPPLLGTQQLLNFTATSLPGIGGLAAMLSLAVASVVALVEWFRGRRVPAVAEAPSAKRKDRAHVVVAV